MAVVAIIGLMAGAAVVFVRPTSYAATARGYAHEVTALCDQARQRAVATRKYQRIEADDDGVIHYEATDPGMTIPTEWTQVITMSVPNQVVIASFDDVTHASSDTDVPTVGVGLPGTIDFAPDGTATAGTIFVTDSADDKRARVAVYRASGSAYTYQDW
jgi:Tfp pilus assembly protein FimT